jgi:hypothetical protein
MTLFEAKITARKRIKANRNCGKGFIALCFYRGQYFICSALHARVNFYKVIKHYPHTY